MHIKKKETHFSVHPNKKTKLNTEPNEIYHGEDNKQNRNFRSMAETAEEIQLHKYSNKLKISDQFVNCTNSSTVVSPTFQESKHQLNLNNQLFKEENPKYLMVNFSLKQLQADKKPCNVLHKLSYQQLQNKLINYENNLLAHYQSKKFWKKIEELFQKEGVDGMFAWQESIEKYKSIKMELEASKQKIFHLQKELNIKLEKINLLEKQIQQDKNQTRVLSQKKCKGCENIDQKQKEHYEIYQKNKKLLVEIQEDKQKIKSLSEKLKNSIERYDQTKKIKEQIDRKNQELFKRQKQNILQIERLREIVQSSKILHIENQKLKEGSYKNEKIVSKLEDKYLKELNDKRQKIEEIQQQRNIYQEQMQKIKFQYNEIRPKVLKLELENSDLKSLIEVKSTECQQLKKKHRQNLSSQINNKNDLIDKIKQKEDELARSYQLLDESQNIRMNLQLDLKNEKQRYQQKEEQVDKIQKLNQQLECKIKQFEENEYRIKESNHYQNITKTKNSHHPQQNISLSNRRIFSKIKQILQVLKGDNFQSVHRKKGRDYQEFDDNISMGQIQKYLSEALIDISDLANRYGFILRDNEILKDKIEERQRIQDHYTKEIDLKDEVIKYFISFMPEQCEDLGIDLMCVVCKLIEADEQQQTQLQRYFQRLKQELAIRSKNWKAQIQRTQRENEQLKRKIRQRNEKKDNQQFQFKQFVNKKEIRKKYNLDY